LPQVVWQRLLTWTESINCDETSLPFPNCGALSVIIKKEVCTRSQSEALFDPVDSLFGLHLARENTVSLWYIFAETCKRQANDRAIWTRERSWTFKELHDQAARYALWLIDQDIRPGDLVALYLLNSAEFMMLALAALCIGAAPALINYNLEGGALLHCLSVCSPKLLLVDEDAACQQRINGSQHQIEEAGTRIVPFDGSLRAEISSRQPIVPGDEWRKDVRGESPYCLLYVSCPSLEYNLHVNPLWLLLTILSA
jgi:non-ribosomal peptide synthetase component F